VVQQHAHTLREDTQIRASVFLIFSSEIMKFQKRVIKNQLTFYIEHILFFSKYNISTKFQ
jgi:hypothetical protein